MRTKMLLENVDSALLALKMCTIIGTIITTRISFDLRKRLLPKWCILHGLTTPFPNDVDSIGQRKACITLPGLK